MNPTYVRTMLNRLLADLRRDPRLGRPRSFMNRYGRPIGFGLAVGIGGVGCSGGSDSTSTDAGPSDDVYTRDTLPPMVDAYGISSKKDVAADTRDAVPMVADAYGISVDTRDAVPDAIDAYGISPDTRDAVPRPVDAYGIIADAPSPNDTRDTTASPIDGGVVDADSTG